MVIIMSLRRKIASVGAATCLIAVGSLVATTPAHAAVNGTVDCVNKQVLGVWVEALEPAKRGWASISPIEGNYRYSWSISTLSSSDTYQLHVGCGDWSPSMKSDMSYWHSGDFICKRNWGLSHPANYCIDS